MGRWETLNNDQKDQIRQAFEICDADHNGFIDIEELKEVLKALGEVCVPVIFFLFLIMETNVNIYIQLSHSSPTSPLHISMYNMEQPQPRTHTFQC